MSKVKLYNQVGEENGEIEIAEAVFGVTPKADVVHQVYIAQLANARQPWADTKGRGEVSGGGKKPWKQKGTGRARHGSIRSPIWKGGGVTFGPLSTRTYTQKINKKMNALAVRMCLSDKVAEQQFVVVEDFVTDGKTKTLSALRAKLPGKGRTALVLTAGNNTAVRKAVSNLTKTTVTPASDVNVVEVINHRYIIASRAAVAMLEKRLR